MDEEIPIAAGDALRVLVAFPPAGASQGIFSGLRRALGKPTQVIAPDILGRGSRTGGDLPLTALAAKLAGELPDRIADRRYAVFGTSFGSIVAFEYVREIQARHLHLPELLIVSGRQPPEDTDDFAECASWTDDEVWKYLLKSQPEGTDLRTAPAELQGLAIEWFKRDIRLGAGYRYVPSEPLNVPIVVCHGTRDRGVGKKELRAWERHTSKSFTIHSVTGGHFFYVSRPDALIDAVPGLNAAKPRS